MKRCIKKYFDFFLVSRNKNSEKEVLYIMAITALPFMALLVFLLKTPLGNYIRSLIPKCALYAKTGVYCPGCGMTRACTHLLNFRIAESINTHPTAFYCAVVFIIFTGYEFYARHVGKKGFSNGMSMGFVYVGLLITMVQWVLKLLGIIKI